MGGLTMPLWQVLELTNDPYDPDAFTPPLGSGGTIGLDRYPVLGANPVEQGVNRAALNRLIIDHYYLREIGQETISIFTFLLRRTMREIMPAYNQLYASMRLDFDPLSTYELHTVRSGQASEQAARDSTSSMNRTGTDTGQSSSQADSTTGSTADAESRSVFFDTPQTALSRNKDYAANATDAATHNTGTGTSSGTTTGTTSATSTGTDTGTGTDSTTGSSTTADSSTTTGRQGSASRLLNEYRSTIINTDRLLLAEPELASMFALVWDDGRQIAAPDPTLRGITSW